MSFMRFHPFAGMVGAALLTTALLDIALLGTGCGSDDTSQGGGALTPAAGSAGLGSAGSASVGAAGTGVAAGGSGAAAEPGAGVSGGSSAPEGMGGAPLDPGAGGASGAAASAGGSAAVGGGLSPFPSGVTRPQLMIVGDSISAGPGCYKGFLLAELQANGFNDLDFVGEYTDDCGRGVMHSARSCTTALDYTQPTFTLREDCGGGSFPGLSALMATHQPDLVMLQLGVNDVWNGLATDAILANYSTLVQQARVGNPNVVIAVAQIHQIRPMGPDADAVFARAEQLIEAVPAWAASESQATSPVFVADLWTDSDAAQTLDGVHPDDAGAQRMGSNWFEALSAILPRD
jgi:hypothetical protein